MGDGFEIERLFSFFKFNKNKSSRWKCDVTLLNINREIIQPAVLE